jgi:myo-inositol-1(or 4)-monophosphatase
MAIPSPSELTFVAIQAALGAGGLLRRGFGTEFAIGSKEGVQNLVTEYDKAAEKSIISAILKHFPDHAFLAEESGETHQGKSPVTWIIDPLDGTVNFARQVPVFSISIAAAIEKNIVSGVVYQPMTNELFVAEKGKGAYLNGKQIFVSKIDSLKKALLATGFPYDVHKNPRQCIDLFAEMQRTGVPIRRLGSAAIDLAYVAAGRFDAFWEVGLNAWDMAAGKLLVEEAGGKVTHWDGSPHKIFGYETLLASNARLHPEMIERCIKMRA